VDLAGKFIYYVGPVDPVRDEVVGPAGPTTATRMDKFTEQVLAQTGLLGMIGKSDEAKYFVFEEAPFFSQRENQLVQAYMEQYGAMPKGVGADELDDLF
jgi:hypothetical protein